MYANHDLYNELIAFLEKHSLGWTKETAPTVGKRFVEGMSKALFQCCPNVYLPYGPPAAHFKKPCKKMSQHNIV